MLTTSVVTLLAMLVCTSSMPLSHAPCLAAKTAWWYTRPLAPIVRCGQPMLSEASSDNEGRVDAQADEDEEDVVEPSLIDELKARREL